MIFGKLQAAIMLQRYFFRGLQSFLNRIPMKTKLVNYNKKKRQINVIYGFKSTACLGCALGWIFCTFTVDGFCATSRNIKLWGKQTINKDGICATASTHHSFFTLPASRRRAGVLFVTVHHASVPVPRSPFCHAEVGVGLTLTAVTVSGLMRLEVIAPTAWCHLWCCSTVQETLLQDQLLCSFVLQAGSEAPMTFFTFFSFLPFLKFV